MPTVTLGQLIARHREARGWTVARLAVEAQVRANDIVRVEAGAEPRARLLAVLCSALLLTAEEEHELLLAAMSP